MDNSALFNVLAKQTKRSEKRLTDRHPNAVQFLLNSGITPGKIRDHAARLLTSGILSGTMMLAAPGLHHILPPKTSSLAQLSIVDRQKFFGQEIDVYLPKTVSPLTADQEQGISRLISEFWGIESRSSLDGERLNQSYGLIGAEQHLPRYPGDTVQEHDSFQEKGITPGKGAWGYFSYSKDELTPELVEKEKYYVAVQTLYLPDWNSRLAYLRDWYKYRKVIVVNPANGKTIICDIADAGPAAFTGKHFGGSPEVMAFLGLNVGMQKGPVVLFFVDDPHNTIPLGPAQYNPRKENALALK